MKNSQTNILVFTLKKCNQFRIRKYKKFVDWCDEWYLHLLSYAYNFCMANKTIVLLVVKILVKYVDK